MPNWVYNYVTVTATTDEQLNEFKKHISIIPEFYNAGNNDFDEPKKTMSVNDFSFHSFITLDKEHKEEYHQTNGSGPNGVTGDTEYNWYNWNNANWNTKWDACSPSIDIQKTQVVISFETAWGAPEPVFAAMSEQFPNCTFDITWEEEQGYGAEFTLKNGSAVGDVKSWDIPASHADFVDQDKECYCSTSDDEDYWFDDCPNKAGKKVFTVDTITRRFIVAYTEEEALEAAKAEEGGSDLPTNTEVKDTLYAEEFRVVGETDSEDEKEGE